MCNICSMAGSYRVDEVNYKFRYEWGTKIHPRSEWLCFKNRQPLCHKLNENLSIPFEASTESEDLSAEMENCSEHSIDEGNAEMNKYLVQTVNSVQIPVNCMKKIQVCMKNKKFNGDVLVTPDHSLEQNRWYAIGPYIKSIVKVNNGMTYSFVRNLTSRPYKTY